MAAGPLAVPPAVPGEGRDGVVAECDGASAERAVAAAAVGGTSMRAGSGGCGALVLPTRPAVASMLALLAAVGGKAFRSAVAMARACADMAWG